VKALKQKALEVTRKTVQSANKLEKKVAKKSVKLAHKTAHSILHRSALKVKLIKAKQDSKAKIDANLEKTDKKLEHAAVEIEKTSVSKKAKRVLKAE